MSFLPHRPIRGWKIFDDLLSEIQNRASKVYRQWLINPFAGDLRFKRVKTDAGAENVELVDYH